ncbi:hypothetical protein L6164_035835 [Bauhinia variegata]|uniref:Uncharacterized protein n=1 Tax=Bauhinia variegata TaxID=167791 RepID=A0ACB9KFG2_BAUVA|nr:hypothetical protein L6164_035835 [Bauhinia variegata]
MAHPPIPMAVSKFILSLLVSSLAFLSDVAFADPPYNICSTSTSYTNGSLFQKNLNNVLFSLPINASISKSYNVSSGNDPDRVYSLYMCLDYISMESCQSCIATARQDIVKLCPQAEEAVIWEDECQLRYSNRNFFGKVNVTGNIGKDNIQNISAPEKLQSAVNDVLYNITEMAAFNSSANMYATTEAPFEDKTIYALVQCTGDLSAADCSACLKSAIKDIPGCCYASIGARILSRSCYLRYEFYPFYEGATGPTDTSSSNITGKNGASKPWMITGIIALTGLAIIFCCCICCVMNKSRKSGSGNFSHLIELHNTSQRGDYVFHQQSFRRRSDGRSNKFPYIDLSSLSEATRNFSDSNKLGEGGFGPVYKAWHLWNDGKGLDLMDPLLADSCCRDQFLTYMNIGLLCVQEDAYDRPTMSSVVLMLKSESATHGQPERPPFSMGKLNENGSNGQDYEHHSVNGLTISRIVPR